MNADFKQEVENKTSGRNSSGMISEVSEQILEAKW